MGGSKVIAGDKKPVIVSLKTTLELQGRSSVFKSCGWPFQVLETNLSNVSAGSTDPSTVFSTLDWDHLAKICQHSRKQCLKIRKVVNFDSF